MEITRPTIDSDVSDGEIPTQIHLPPGIVLIGVYTVYIWLRQAAIITGRSAVDCYTSRSRLPRAAAVSVTDGSWFAVRHIFWEYNIRTWGRKLHDGFLYSFHCRFHSNVHVCKQNIKQVWNKIAVLSRDMFYSDKKCMGTIHNNYNGIDFRYKNRFTVYFARACVRACVRACARARACVCVCVCVCFAESVSQLVLWAQLTTKDYIRAEHKLHSVSKLFISQVVIPQVTIFKPIYFPRALNTGTCSRSGDLLYSADLHRNHVLTTANTGKIGRGFGKNACEWTGRVEISKEEIPCSKRSMYGCILTYSRLLRENV